MPIKITRRDRSRSPLPPTRNPSEPLDSTSDEICFPRSFEAAWTAAGANGQTDVEKARSFLFFFGSFDAATNAALRNIASDTQHQDVISLAAAVQMQVFGNRHASFATTPLLQWMRFILIKSATRVPSAKAKQVQDFFFDPAMSRNLPQLPDDPVRHQYPAGPLKVVIVGGGPTGLASAIALAEKAGSKVEIHVYEGRWVQQSQSSFVEYPPTARRRDQVVTLQDHVTNLMSEETRQALFEGFPERVWPTSANLQIRKVEDRLMRRAQDTQFKGIVHLHAGRVTREELVRTGDFHLMLGTDGASSWVRNAYFQGEDQERGKSYSLGVAINRPQGLPRPQPLNVFLTLGQTRYLLNDSDFDGTGYVNMQLTESEWHQSVSRNGHPCTFGQPGCLRLNGRVPDGFREDQVFAPSEDPGNPFWRSIVDGLTLFGFDISEVTSIVRIPIVVRGVKKAVTQLPLSDSAGLQRPHGIVALAGDAAMTVHFWPGRGLNSGIKSGIAWADEVVNALHTGGIVGLPQQALEPYSDFLQRLRYREHDRRSMPIINQSGDPAMMDWLMRNARLVPYKLATEYLVGMMRRVGNRLEQRGEWQFDPVQGLEKQLRNILASLSPVTIQEMAATFPWPTQEMAGAEILPARYATDNHPKPKRGWLGGGGKDKPSKSDKPGKWHRAQDCQGFAIADKPSGATPADFATQSLLALQNTFAKQAPPPKHTLLPKQLGFLPTPPPSPPAKYTISAPIRVLAT